MDNLNTHTPAALYEIFAPAEARRLLEKLELHYTRHPRQLVEYGRDRTLDPQPTVFGPPHRFARRTGA